MPKTTKKKPLRRPASRKKVPAQSEGVRVLSLALKIDEWARRHNLSFGDALEQALNGLDAKDQALEDPILRALENAPEDDEPFTDEERAEEEEGWRECQQGLGRPWEEVRKELAGGKQ